MMDSLQQSFTLIFELFSDGFFALLGIAIVGPMLGVLLVLRRMPLLGLAAPQLASCGQAAAHFLFALIWVNDTSQSERPGIVLQVLVALVFVTLGLVVIGLCSRDRRFLGVHAGIAYFGAIALQELFYLESPYHFVMEETAHHGQLLTVGDFGRNCVLACCGLAFLACMAMWRRLWVSALDTDQATLLGLSPRRALVATLLLLGGFCTICAPVVGPLTVLTLLLVPPAFLRSATPSLAAFAPLSILAGVLGAAAGFVLACTEGVDWPPGPAVTLCVVASSLLVALCARFLTRKRLG